MNRAPWNWPDAGWITRDEMLKIPAAEISSPCCFDTTPAVSVLMMTRNHAPYLSEAVRSVIDQDFKEPIEILIGEDFSSDQTLEVAISLQNQYPRLIRVFHADKNVGITSNFLRLVAKARAPYLALLEGDDYWTHPSKLTLQIEQLRHYPQASLAAAATANRTPCLPRKKFYTVSDLLRRYGVHTSTLVIRAEHLTCYPRFPDIIGWITMTMGYLAARGDCIYLDTVVSFYRRHEGGLWHNAERLNRLHRSRQCIDALDAYFFHRFRRELLDRELWIYGMDLTLPQTGGVSHWLQSWSILIGLIPRLAHRAPLSTCLLFTRLLLQPMRSGWITVRRRIALRTRLRPLIKFHTSYT